MAIDFEDYANDPAVYWPPMADVAGEPVCDDFGNPTYDQPEKIACRWTDHEETFRDRGGNTRVSKSVILTTNNHVPADVMIKTGGVLWKGSIYLLTSEKDPFANTGAQLVQGVKAIPDADGEDTLYKVYL